MINFKAIMTKAKAKLVSSSWMISPIIDMRLYLTLSDLAITLWVFTIS